MLFKKVTSMLLAASITAGLLTNGLGTVYAAAPENLALGKKVAASSFEVASTSPEKAVDGDLETRWGTNQNAAENEWIEIDLGGEKDVKQICVNFERRDENQNILSFKVELKKGDTYTKVYQKDERAKQKEVVTLEQPQKATHVKLTVLAADGGKEPVWKNVGINEIEVYSEVNTSVTLDEVKARVEALPQEQKVVAADADQLALPKVPDGFTIALNGADFEQVIGADLTVVHPLTDKEVKVSYVITETETGKTKETADITYLVKGMHTQPEGKNEKPVIIPEIQEWYSESGEKLAADSLKKVVYSDASLEAVVDEFIADYKDFTGMVLSKEKGNAQAGAFNFVKEAPDALLGEEGYTMEILADRIIVKSESSTGNMYGMQTILQMYKQDAEGFVLGQMRDYPRFATRGFLFDVARKPVSLEMIGEVARTMRYYKMNDLQPHLSDNYIFLENYGKLQEETEAFKAYDAFRLESSLTNKDGVSPTAEDYFFTKAEFKNFIQEQRALGMKIVPEIDVPAHANSFTKVWPELMVQGKVSQLNARRPLIDHLDVSKKETVDKIKEIFDDYTKGEDPTFDQETTVHIGADEFLDSYSAYRRFVNEIVPYIKKTNTVRMWGGLTWIKDNPVTEIVPEAIENVEMNLWSKDWADGMEMYEMGYKLINTIDDYGYMVPNGSLGRANAYGDLLNVDRIFNSFEPNLVATRRNGYQYIPSGDDQMLGAAFALWNDNIDKHSAGLTESDLYWRFFDALPFYAEKTWAATGKEKGTADVLAALAQEQGTGPRTNPYYEEDKIGDHYEAYTFTNGLKDVTENKRDLTAGENAAAADGALVLNGGKSFVTSPIKVLGNGNMLSFDITLTEEAKAGEILFEADAPYGTHDIRILSDGSLGFTRELHEYSFGYKLPVGEKVNIRIEVQQQSTTLYVNGKLTASATGKFIHNDIEKKTGITNATLALPLQRIGSRTSAVSAKIDNVIVTSASADYHKENWTGTTNSETEKDDTEGLLKYAFDGKTNTIWHSNWQGVTDKLENGKTYYAEINFGTPYLINEFSFTPRRPQASGQITKADLFIKAAEGDEWKQVAADQVFEANGNKKTFVFDEQEVQFVKFVAKESNDGWVAVSEFDIGNSNFTLPEEPEQPEKPENPFTDITEKDYFYGPVIWAHEKEIVQGYGDTGKFMPHADCTRANVVTFLYRAAGEPTPEGKDKYDFTDVPADAYYAKALQWAYENDIVKGYGNTGKFMPDAPCTRANIVAFLYRAAGEPTPEGKDKYDFSDVPADAYYAEALQWSYENEIVQGYGDTGKFMPDYICSRAQTVTFLHRSAK